MRNNTEPRPKRSLQFIWFINSPTGFFFFFFLPQWSRKPFACLLITCWRSVSNIWPRHDGRVLPQSASPYWRTVRHLIRVPAPLTTSSSSSSSSSCCFMSNCALMNNKPSFSADPLQAPLVLLYGNATRSDWWGENWGWFFQKSLGPSSLSARLGSYSARHLVSLHSASLRLVFPLSLSAFEGGHVKSITQSAQWSEAHLPVDSF